VSIIDAFVGRDKGFIWVEAIDTEEKARYLKAIYTKWLAKIDSCLETLKFSNIYVATVFTLL
jgi:mannose/fructose-specific phosphotransferase system component IIA